MPRLWKHEKAIRRTESLIDESDETCDCACCKEWHSVARRICQTARLLKSAMTPLVLHCIDVAGRELSEKRHENARLFLLTAQAMVEDKLMAHLNGHLFPQVFAHMDAPGAPQQSPHMQMPPLPILIGTLLGKLDQLPEGASTINIGGVPAQVIKYPTGQPKKKKSKSIPPDQGGNPRLN